MRPEECKRGERRWELRLSNRRSAKTPTKAVINSSPGRWFRDRRGTASRFSKNDSQVGVTQIRDKPSGPNVKYDAPKFVIEPSEKSTLKVRFFRSTEVVIGKVMSGNTDAFGPVLLVMSN
jgi:hypothetical protein